MYVCTTIWHGLQKFDGWTVSRSLAMLISNTLLRLDEYSEHLYTGSLLRWDPEYRPQTWHSLFRYSWCCSILVIFYSETIGSAETRLSWRTIARLCKCTTGEEKTLCSPNLHRITTIRLLYRTVLIVYSGKLQVTSKTNHFDSGTTNSLKPRLFITCA